MTSRSRRCRTGCGCSRRRRSRPPSRRCAAWSASPRTPRPATRRRRRWPGSATTTGSSRRPRAATRRSRDAGRAPPRSTIPLKPRGHAVGIDLGTTNSLVAAVIEGKPRAFPVDEGGSLLLPSVVHYAQRRLGHRRRAGPGAGRGRAPTDTIASVKRFMGKRPGGRGDEGPRRLPLRDRRPGGAVRGGGRPRR